MYVLSSVSVSCQSPTTARHDTSLIGVPVLTLLLLPFPAPDIEMTTAVSIPPASPLRRVFRVAADAAGSLSRRLGLTSLFSQRRRADHPPTPGFSHSSAASAAATPVLSSALPRATLQTPASVSLLSFFSSSSSSSSSSDNLRKRKRKASFRKGRCPFECNCGVQDAHDAKIASGALDKKKQKIRLKHQTFCVTKTWAQENKRRKQLEKASNSQQLN